MMTKTTTVAAPGKALLAGGYCVLEAPNPGLVFATDSCFHATISSRPLLKTQEETQDTIDGSLHHLENSSRFPIDVYSSQFHQVYSYWLFLAERQCENDSRSVRVEPRHSETARNPYVEKTLLLAFTYVHETHENLARYIVDQCIDTSTNRAIAIRLLADNDFYSSLSYLKSHNLPVMPQSVSNLPPFLPCPIDDQGHAIINKTGLGSSATLVSSLVGAILLHFEVVDLSDDEGRRILHNLAQVAHSLIQGKVGSGFDVSAALYGSHIYTRFNPAIIQDVLVQLEQDLSHPSDENEHAMSITHTCAMELVKIVQDKAKVWDSTVEALSMPKGLEMMMADVCGGSESPSMARKVLKWKRELYSVTETDESKEGGKEDYWNQLLEANLKLKELFERGSSFEIPAVMSTRRIASLDDSPKIDNKGRKDGSTENHKISEEIQSRTIPFLISLRSAFLQSRSYLKQIGVLASVPIEPDEQTDLANATMDVPGVIAAGVPGAGGYDALYVIYVKSEDSVDKLNTRDKIGRVWEDWCSRVNVKGGRGIVCPLNCKSVGFGDKHGLHQVELDWT